MLMPQHGDPHCDSCDSCAGSSHQCSRLGKKCESKQPTQKTIHTGTVEDKAFPCSTPQVTRASLHALIADTQTSLQCQALEQPQWR